MQNSSPTNHIQTRVTSVLLITFFLPEFSPESPPAKQATASSRLPEHSLIVGGEIWAAWASPSSTFPLHRGLVRHPSLFEPQALMEAVSSKIKSLALGAKRKNSSNNIQSTFAGSNHLTPTSTHTNTPTTTLHNSSTTSLPMNPQQNPAGRPPSYSYNTAGRPITPLPPGHPQAAHHPPPINTAQQFPPANPTMPPAQPPGYGGYATHPPQAGGHTMNQYARPAEVDGGGRSKAQLIVGIDFVRSLPRPFG